MTLEEYNQRMGKFMVKAGIIGLLLAAMVAGCTATKASGYPDITSAGDNKSIAEHARAYWGKDKEVQTEVLVIPKQNQPEVGLDEATVQPDTHEAYLKGVADTVKAFRNACLNFNEFYVTHNGAKEHYGCMSTRKVVPKAKDNVFTTD